MIVLVLMHVRVRGASDLCVLPHRPTQTRLDAALQAAKVIKLGASTTATEVITALGVSLAGRNAIVTGA